MPISDKPDELRRLIAAFEAEAHRFHPTTFSLEYLVAGSGVLPKPVAQKHHGIPLWQYFGPVGNEPEVNALFNAVTQGTLKWGVPGAQVTCLGIIEGEQFDLFARMGLRAGSLFDPDEVRDIKLNLVNELIEGAQAKNPRKKIVTVTNDNPLAVWLNYLVYHVSQTHPGRELHRRIEPEPFTLSLLALERLASGGAIGKKMDSAITKLSERRFRVALSFSGDRRLFVAEVARRLSTSLGEHAVFYDKDYQAHLAQPGMDVLLQNVYRRQSDLLAVFLCEQYANRDWCGLEWRTVRDLIKSRQQHQVMLIRLDDAPVEGLLSIDGYFSAGSLAPEAVAAAILERVQVT